MHQKLFAWSLETVPTVERMGGSSTSLPVMDTRMLTTLRVRILIEGIFPFHPKGQGEEGQNGQKEGDEDECDVVVGISDGKTVWAVGRGESGLDTIPPFDFGSSTRSGAGTHFYDVYSQKGGGHGAFWAHIE
jgi:hypothetical protein